MLKKLSATFFVSTTLGMFLLHLNACTTHECYNSPDNCKPPAIVLNTKEISRATGGPISFLILNASTSQTVLNQVDPVMPYVIAKLIQNSKTGTHSATLVLSLDGAYNHYTATVAPNDLSSFDIDTAQLDVTTQDGHSAVYLKIQ